jgi:glycosyltransferase involved in cell wall biosynthesis
LISVVVPAHDEGRTIGRCLRSLCEGADPGELEVVVVCNGCRDDTVDRARSVAGPIRVIESPVASKSDALNRGDALAAGFPRFYVDADVVLSISALRGVAEALESASVLVAAPRAEIDLRSSSSPVRSFYRVWTGLPYFDDTMIGAGVYALSEAGRARFERFPNIIADDEFVRRTFAPGERQRVDACSFTIVAPTRLRGVLAIKTRSRLGRLELARRFPDLGPRGGPAMGGTLQALLGRPSLWPHLPVYLFAILMTRIAAWRRFRAGDFTRWNRDDSSRSIPD